MLCCVCVGCGYGGGVPEAEYDGLYGNNRVTNNDIQSEVWSYKVTLQDPNNFRLIYGDKLELMGLLK